MKQLLFFALCVLAGIFCNGQDNKYARIWKVSDFGAYPNDCNDDWAGIQKAIDSSYKLPGLTKLILNNGWDSLIYPPGISNPTIGSTELVFCQVDYILFDNTRGRMNWIILEFDRNITTTLTLECWPCKKFKPF